MDMAGGSCNYKGIEVIHSLETGGKCYYRGSVLPSTASLKRAAKQLEAKAAELVPFKEVQTQWEKSIQFCEARTLHLACDMYGITEKAKCTGVSISESIDASQITKNLHVITAGFNMQDVDKLLMPKETKGKLPSFQRRF
jgi:GTP-sensing pleiotropic transcriptional regulator CodY